jgi:ABC-type polysaccharide/polyol phosphate export permease
MEKTEPLTLDSALRIQIRVIHALLMREILTRYGRHNLGFLWMFVEPMMFTLGVTALWTATSAVHGSTIPIAAFALSGYSSVLLWRNMPSRCIGAVSPNLSLMYHRNVKLVDIFATRILLEGAGATMSFVLLSSMFISIELISPPEDLLMVVGGWLMLAWFGIALGLLMGTLAEEFELVEKIWHPASYLLFPLSGAAFLVDALPKQAQDFVLLLPMVHGVEYVREGYFGSQIVSHYNLGYMAVCCAAVSLLALAQLRKVSRIVIPE